MPLTLFLFVCAILSSAAAGVPETESLDEVLKNLETGTGMLDLGRDGVLRSLNPAHDRVLNYVQLSEAQITELLAKLGKTPVVMAGVDGRTVMSDAQLWAVPEDVLPGKSAVPRSMPGELSSLEEALKTFNEGELMNIGADGVLRSFNAAHDTVLDYVQLSKPQIAELLVKIGSKISATPGVKVLSFAILSR
ncbi:hypothetical protein BKA58DRAFT_437030 [Alternaria rosae]|uniref:uncharacterized protein n=1 Tax=Alternaria rosae TaxID=1187941 RepID=UPI001E8E481A|nr:uncharacterized protein BKA58DRAFT_437030 [Alternaria rosae]KAH6875032.1 hypothetical protein BKA58DRAFT_437030 [Alternaria rosae]